MKKLLVAGVVLALLVLMAACREKSKCDFCGEQDWCATEIVFNQEVSVCPECSREFENG